MRGRGAKSRLGQARAGIPLDRNRGGDLMGPGSALPSPMRAAERAALPPHLLCHVAAWGCPRPIRLRVSTLASVVVALLVALSLVPPASAAADPKSLVLTASDLGATWQQIDQQQGEGYYTGVYQDNAAPRLVAATVGVASDAAAADATTDKWRKDAEANGWMMQPV